MIECLAQPPRPQLDNPLRTHQVQDYPGRADGPWQGEKLVLASPRAKCEHIQPNAAAPWQLNGLLCLDSAAPGPPKHLARPSRPSAEYCLDFRQFGFGGTTRRHTPPLCWDVAHGRVTAGWDLEMVPKSSAVGAREEAGDWPPTCLPAPGRLDRWAWGGGGASHHAVRAQI
ncbi:hypothetical protein S7711_10625 [Stachybotrys chartarum IBT 7711]|uniref:Uncharacterized protein n=1 Tax=Stachybotrys chartarum (strain CBS 109288 / IBT 7711) TaxID=1280523 RepID=A0A084ALV8_STACB|nr:hypothetical protein S7711_10625 [Stachybotrys chartarum IBT 7711]